MYEVIGYKCKVYTHHVVVTFYSRKTSNQLHHNSNCQPLDNSGFDDDDDVTSSYYRQNSTSPGRVFYTVSYDHELL